MGKGQPPGQNRACVGDGCIGLRMKKESFLSSVPSLIVF